jgi:hypothetical protein
MTDETSIIEHDKEGSEPDPDEVPIRDRRVFTQPYDLVVESLVDQIKGEQYFFDPCQRGLASSGGMYRLTFLHQD